LKGSGWYVTDYAGKKPSGSGADDSAEGNGNGDSTDAKVDSDCASSSCPKSSGKEAAPATKKESSDTPSAGSAS